MNLIKHIAIAGLLAVAPALVLAQTTTPAPAAGATTPATKDAGAKGGHMSKRGERFKAADKDGDGAISKAEAEAAGMKRVSANFDKLDTNKDGKLTRDEMKAGRVAHRSERKGAKAGATPATPATPAAPAAK